MPQTPQHSRKPQDRSARRVAATLASPLLAAALSLVPPAAGAADAEGRFSVKGAGATACADFVAAVAERGQRLVAYGGWLEGYLTAANQHTEQTFDLTSWETPQTLALLLYNHCQGNPELSFLDATRMMFGALHDARIESGSDLVVVNDGEQGMRLYSETVRRVQRRLAEEGLYTGQADGLYGDGTRAAIRAFQQNAGFEPTGLPDQQTLMQLLRKPRN